MADIEMTVTGQDIFHRTVNGKTFTFEGLIEISNGGLRSLDFVARYDVDRVCTPILDQRASGPNNEDTRAALRDAIVSAFVASLD